MSAPRLQDWPIPACTPDSGRITPIFNGPPCARPMLNGAVPASKPAAPAPAAKLRRVTPARAEFLGDYGSLSSSQDTVISRRVRYFSYCSMQDAMGHERALRILDAVTAGTIRALRKF